MKQTAFRAGLVVVAFASAGIGCSDSSDGAQSVGAAGTLGTVPTGAAGVSQPAAGSSGSAGTGTITPPITGAGAGGTGPIATAGRSGGTAGMPMVTAGTMSAGAAGAPGIAGTGGGAGMAAPVPTPPGVNEPIIPEASGECPTFMTGTQTILDLSTEMVVGPPTSVKGPMLFTWHGTGGNGKQALRQLPQSVQQDIMSQGGIVIAASSNGQTRAGANVALSVWFDGHDLQYADLLVACAVKNHNIDPRRIYVTGCSAGGLMSGVMAMLRSNYVAAVAPNSGGLTTPRRLQDAMRAPNAMTMHGGSGDTVIVNFADTSHTFQEALQPSGTFVVECNHNMGHCRAPAALHERAWDFMKAHPFGTKPSPFEGGLPDGFPDYCMIIK